MTAEFLCGPLADAALVALVMGRATGVAAVLPGHRLVMSQGFCGVAAVPDPPAEVQGILVELADEARDRLAFWAEVEGFGAVPVTCRVDGAPVAARLWAGSLAESGEDWDAARWRDGDRALCLAVAAEVMAQYGRAPAAAVAGRRQMLGARAASRLRAAGQARPPRPAGRFAAGAVEVAERARPWDGFFAVETWRLRHPLFAGGSSATVERAGFVMADAVTVLPYDPARDRVLVIEQFRFGPCLRGDPWPWTLEPVAGRIDPGETPEAAARREAREEAGVEIGALHPVADYYPTPGAVSEYLFSYIGIAELPDGTGGVHGLADEHEDIRGHLLSVEELDALAAQGGLRNGPMLLSALWLVRHRDRLRHAGA